MLKCVCRRPKLVCCNSSTYYCYQHILYKHLLVFKVCSDFICFKLDFLRTLKRFSSFIVWFLSVLIVKAWCFVVCSRLLVWVISQHAYIFILYHVLYEWIKLIRVYSREHNKYILFMQSKNNVIVSATI